MKTDDEKSQSISKEERNQAAENVDNSETSSSPPEMKDIGDYKNGTASVETKGTTSFFYN